MQTFVMNETEIEHIKELRTLPDGQKEAILRATHALSVVHPHLVLVQPAVIVQFSPRSAES